MSDWKWHSLAADGLARFDAGSRWQSLDTTESAPLAAGIIRHPLTDQQQTIIHQAGNLRINAVAGSGKTSTLTEYARHQPSSHRGLYLAFNRTVREEAQRKFNQQGIRGVKAHTAHSLAYEKVIKKASELLPSGEYTAFELASSLPNIPEVSRQLPAGRRPWLSLAAHVLRWLKLFCNASDESIRTINYLESLRYEERKVRVFAQNFYGAIQAGAHWLWEQMDQRKIGVTYDYFLKKYQLLKPRLKYDYLLFDEGQDASPVMLDVFLKQAGRKVIVGDTHQQIYGFRYAVNSLEQVDFPAFALNRSFRFPASIAALAEQVLALKQLIYPLLDEMPYLPATVEGLAPEISGPSSPTGITATIGRTNLELVAQAIRYLCLEESIGSLYFEGNFDTYTFMDNGVGLLDMVLLQQGKRSGIKNELLKSMQSLDELQIYIDQTGDTQLKTALDLVTCYQAELPAFIDRIREAHLPLSQRRHADLYFSTVHRCKGLEYETVQLCDDFITAEKLADKLQLLQLTKLGQLPKGESPVDPTQVIEEINMLYVALTRTKGALTLAPSQWDLLASMREAQSE